MSLWQALGWLGNACFFARFFVQWLASERAARSVAPSSFWWLSLSGALALGAYSLMRGEPVLLAGYAFTGCIYARNAWIAYFGGARLAPLPLTLLGVCGALALFAIEGLRVRGDIAEAPGWLAVAVVGQLLFGARFLIQWWASEHAGHSHFPRSFWWLSLSGNALLLAYALHLGDAIYIAGFALGPLIQVRNLMLEHERVRASSAAHRTPRVD